MKFCRVARVMASSNERLVIRSWALPAVAANIFKQTIIKMNLSISPLNSERTYYEAEMIKGTGRGPREKSVEELSGSREFEQNRGVRTLTLS